MPWEAELYLNWRMHGVLPEQNLYRMDAGTMLLLLEIQRDCDGIGDGDDA